MLRAALFVLLLSSAVSSAADVKITPAEQKEESAWLESLGVKPPAIAFPLEDPFAQPFTRRSLVVPTAWYRQKAPQTLRADLFREDVKLLHKIMQTAYGGWDSAQRRGWDWDAFFKDWDAALSARGSDVLSLTDAFAPWRKYMEFQLDNHSGPTTGGFAAMGHAFSWTAVLAQAPAGTCTEFRNAKGVTYPMDPSDAAQRSKKREDRSGKPIEYLVTPFTKGPVASVHCGDQWIAAEPAWMPEEDERAANIRTLAETQEDVPAFRDISPRIGYIRFPSFSKRAVELTLKLEPELKNRPHNEELLIVDLRGNGGGDMRIQAVANWTKIPNVEGKSRLGESCLYPPLRWGYMQTSSSGLKPPISDLRRRSFKGMLDDLFHDDIPGCPAKFSETAAKWTYPEHRYPSKPTGKTRILALVDDFCGSDCEGAVQTIAAIPGSVIAGVNTFGVAGFIQPGYFILPNTRLPFRIALGTADDYGDGRSFDGYGFDVDIVLPAKTDQSAANIVALAERLLAAR
jgi:hypothetical protein